MISRSFILGLKNGQKTKIILGIYLGLKGFFYVNKKYAIYWGFAYPDYGRNGHEKQGQEDLNSFCGCVCVLS